MRALALSCACLAALVACAGCRGDAATATEPAVVSSAADAGARADTPPPQKPLLSGPELEAELASAPVADAGANVRTLSGPPLGAESAAVEDVWTLPETPKRLLVSLRHATTLTARVDDAERLPWAVRAESAPPSDGVHAVELTFLTPLAAGGRYVLVVEGTLSDGAARTWTVPLTVESGTDAAAPWQEKPAAKARGRSKRRR